MANRLGAAWVRPRSTEPDDLVDREGERDELMAILADLVGHGTREARVLITGERGVGKSILTRWVVHRFAADAETKVLPIVLDGKSIGYRRFLEALANDIVAGIGTDGDEQMAAWLEELSLLANHHEITRGQVDTVARKYGAQGELSGGLLYKLKARLSWERSTSTATSGGARLQVTDNLLHAALCQTLARLAEREWAVLVFFDDLDQAATSGSPQEIKETLKRLLQLEPCIGLAHLRTEVLFDDVRREFDESLEIERMGEDVLLDILEARRDRWADDDVKRALQVPDRWEPFKRLARVARTPWVYVRWVHGLLRLHPFPPPTSWDDDAELLRLAKKAVTAGVDAALLARFARVVDRCSFVGEGWCRREDLERGQHELEQGEAEERLTAQEFEALERVGLLIPRDRFHPDAGYRMDPMLDVLRPSVAAKLRQPL